MSGINNSLSGPETIVTVPEMAQRSHYQLPFQEENHKLCVGATF